MVLKTSAIISLWQPNISKTLRSAFPNHRTTTSVFLYPGIGIHESAGSFYLQKNEGGWQSEQSKKLVERRERSHRLIVKGAEFEKAFPLSRDLEQEDVQNIMNQLQNNSYNKSIVRQTYISASQKDRQQIAEAVKKTAKGDDS